MDGAEKWQVIWFWAHSVLRSNGAFLLVMAGGSMIGTFRATRLALSSWAWIRDGA
jgi:hypothetical protein